MEEVKAAIIRETISLKNNKGNSYELNRMEFYFMKKLNTCKISTTNNYDEWRKNIVLLKSL
jgi:hypothetical protein